MSFPEVCPRNHGSILSTFSPESSTCRSCIITAKGAAALEFMLFLILAGERRILVFSHCTPIWRVADPVCLAFTGIRVYALRKSWLLSSVALVLAIVPFGVNLVRRLLYAHPWLWFTNVIIGQLRVWVDGREHTSLRLYGYRIYTTKCRQIVCIYLIRTNRHLSETDSYVLDVGFPGF